jgi:hypothetical protein
MGAPHSLPRDADSADGLHTVQVIRSRALGPAVGHVRSWSRRQRAWARAIVAAATPSEVEDIVTTVWLSTAST